MFDGVDWDDGNRAKCTKHGLSHADIDHVLTQAAYFILPDLRHSVDELRYMTMGRTVQGRPAFVIFTVRGREGRLLARPISARYMHAKEVRKYEQALADLQKR